MRDHRNNFPGKRILQPCLTDCYSLEMVLKDKQNLQNMLKAMWAINNVLPISSLLSWRFHQLGNLHTPLYTEIQQLVTAKTCNSCESSRLTQLEPFRWIIPHGGLHQINHPLSCYWVDAVLGGLSHK